MTEERGLGGPAGPITAAELQERQRAARERIRAVQARAEQARSQLTGQTTVATSADRSVTVTVDAAGTLVDLAFAASAAKLPPAGLASTVLRTYRQATAEAVQRTEALMREVVGADAPVLELIRAAVTEPERDHS